MKTSQEILSEVESILALKWETRKGEDVPEPEDVKLSNDAVLLNATVLYADMRESTALVNNYKNWFAAEIYKSYLISACHIIKNNGGIITAFDGDRVMAVFVGNLKNSSAAKCALQINFIVAGINKAVKKKYPDTSYTLSQTMGIDTGPLFVARTGIRKSNDLVWVGRPANYAAKMCNITSSSSVTITADVFNVLPEETKNGGNPKQCMWSKIQWQEMGIVLYQSNWWWKF